MAAYAYDDRWPRMSRWEFYKRRLIRLQPMVILGSVFGAMLFYLGHGAAFPQIATTPVWKLLLSCTLLPLLLLWEITTLYSRAPGYPSRARHGSNVSSDLAFSDLDFYKRA